MTIEKRGNNYRITEMYQGKRYRATVDHLPSKKEAALIIASLYEKKTVCKNRYTFLEASKEYNSIKSNVLSPSTIREYEKMPYRMSEMFQKMHLDDITKSDVQREINIYSSSHSPKSVRNLNAYITAVMKTYIEDFDGFKVTLPKLIKKEPHIPSTEDVRMILAEASGTQFEIPLKLACFGLRRSEVCALDSSDLDGNTLHINKALVQDKDNKWVIKITKTVESTRDISIPQELADMISEINGKIYKGNPDSIYHFLVKQQDKLNLDHFSLHKLRHYFCSSLSEMGIPEADILKLGGWSKPDVMKEIYRHAELVKSKKARDEIANRLGNMIL